MNLYSAELTTNDVLCVPPGWLMLEQSTSLSTAGLVINWLAPVFGADENVQHLLNLIPEKGPAGLQKLRTLLEVAVAALMSSSDS